MPAHLHLEAFQALKSIDKVIGESTDATQLKKMDPKDLCKIYGECRSWIPPAIVLIEFIPIYGPIIGKLIRLLVTLADKGCGFESINLPNPS